jgi:hypothetical protein
MAIPELGLGISIGSGVWDGRVIGLWTRMRANSFKVKNRKVKDEINGKDGGSLIFGRMERPLIGLKIGI